jgi:CBS domain-containing protein
MKARDVMSRSLVSVSPETKVFEVIHLLSENKIGGVPVVDEEGRLLGLVTEVDLFVKEKHIAFSVETAPSLVGRWVDADRLREAYSEVQDLTAADIMSRDVWSVEGDAEVGDLAVEMMERRCTRVPVLERDRVVGMITRLDLLRSLVEA